MNLLFEVVSLTSILLLKHTHIGLYVIQTHTQHKILFMVRRDALRIKSIIVLSLRELRSVGISTQCSGKFQMNIYNLITHPTNIYVFCSLNKRHECGVHLCEINGYLLNLLGALEIFCVYFFTWTSSTKFKCLNFLLKFSRYL